MADINIHDEDLRNLRGKVIVVTGMHFFPSFDSLPTLDVGIFRESG